MRKRLLLGMAAAIAVPVVAFWGAGSVVRAVEGGSISGTVYFDTDMDGQRDPGEAPAPGKTVALLMGEDEIEVSTMKSASDGRYHFDRLLPDASYAAKVVHDVDTPCTVGGVYYLPGSEVSTGADLGVIASGDRTVSGTLTSDLNENGMRDAGEPPLGGWHLRLTGYTGLECEADFTTVENGEFKFGQLPGGIYNINVKTAGPTLSQRVAWELTFATRPFDLPGAYPQHALSRCFGRLGVLEERRGHGAGRPRSFGHRLDHWTFRDLDRDGKRDDGEQPFDCCGVLFLRSSAAGLLFLQTAQDRVGVGHYEQVGLPPGDYTVTMGTWTDDPTGRVDADGRPVRELTLGEGEAAVVEFGFGPQPPEPPDEPLPLTPTAAPEPTSAPTPLPAIRPPDTGGASDGSGKPFAPGLVAVGIAAAIVGPALAFALRRHGRRTTP